MVGCLASLPLLRSLPRDPRHLKYEHFLPPSTSAEAVAKILNPTGAATGAGAATGGLLAAMQQSATGFKQGIASMGATATAQYEALTEQAEAALAALEAQYCKPATFTPSE